MFVASVLLMPSLSFFFFCPVGSTPFLAFCCFFALFPPAAVLSGPAFPLTAQ